MLLISLLVFSIVTITLPAYAQEHNISVLSVLPNKTIVGQGMTMRVSPTLKNNGDFTETFNVTCFANAEVVGIEEITLDPDSQATLTFTWNTIDLDRGDYRIRYEASIVSDESNTTDNMLLDGTVFVTIVGDTNNDCVVDIFDVVRIVPLIGAIIIVDSYDPNLNIMDDGVIDIYDIVLVARNFGEECTPQYCLPITTECTNNKPVTNAFVEVYTLDDNLTKSGHVDHHGTYYPMLVEGEYYANCTVTVGLFQQSENFIVPDTDNITMTFSYVDILVRNQNHDPISGANVYADSVFLGVTDVNGHVYACGLLGPEEYTAKATYQGGGTIGSTSLTVLSDGSGSATITKATGPQDYDVQIQVRHEDDSAIPGSYVEIADSGGSTVASGNTDGTGNFDTSLNAGSYTAKVTSSANGTYKEKGFSVSGTTTVTVKFNDEVIVTVVHGSTPVEDAYVRIMGTSKSGYTDQYDEIDFGC